MGRMGRMGRIGRIEGWEVGDNWGLSSQFIVGENFVLSKRYHDTSDSVELFTCFFFILLMVQLLDGLNFTCCFWLFLL